MHKEEQTLTIYTHIESPRDFVWLRIGPYAAFKIDIVTFFDVRTIQRTAQTQYRLGYICKIENRNNICIIFKKKNLYKIIVKKTYNKFPISIRLPM